MSFFVQFSRDISKSSMESAEVTSSAPAILINDRQPWKRQCNRTVPLILNSTKVLLLIRILSAQKFIWQLNFSMLEIID